MRLTGLMFMIFFITGIFINQADARPKYRYDKATETCRTLYTGPLEYESRAWGRGGQVFNDVCKSCHTRDNDQGAPFLWAESKTMKGWNRVFAKKYPQCAKDGSWDPINLEDQLMVNDYLYRFGYGSQDVSDNC